MNDVACLSSNYIFLFKGNIKVSKYSRNLFVGSVYNFSFSKNISFISAGQKDEITHDVVTFVLTLFLFSHFVNSESYTICLSQSVCVVS